jgi:Zn finger protein HypA/HybF involved in hydrogenase expression
MQAAGFDPIEKYPGSSKPWTCKCRKCDATFQTSLMKVKSGDFKKCPNCRLLDRKVFAEETVSIMVAAGVEPLEPYPGSNSKPWKSKCLTCGQVVKPAFANVKSGGGGCIHCGIKKVANSKFLDPSETEQRMLEAGLRPLEPYTKAIAKWKCLCLKCGEIVFPTYNGIQQGEGGCLFCGIEKRSAQIRNDVEQAKQLMVEKGLEPIEEYRSGNSPWLSKCLKCESIVSPTLNNVTTRQKNYGCVYCQGGKITEETAIQVLLKAGAIPLDKYPGKDQPWKSKCVKCERIITPTYANARRGQGACKFCATHGIDLLAPTYLYVLEHNEFNSYKVGIGKFSNNLKNDRIHRLSKEGWILIRKYSYETGLEAFEDESLIFNEIRINRKIPVFLTSELMSRTAGHTETLGRDSIELPELISLIEDVRQASFSRRSQPELV